MASQPAAGTTTTGAFSAVFEDVVANVSRVIHGKQGPTRLALICMLSEGHLFARGRPRAWARRPLRSARPVFRSSVPSRPVHSRPASLRRDGHDDLRPRVSGHFEFRPGPVFANVVIGDEINRASPKTQSALLEAMQERQVTIDNTTHRLPAPFIVLATQNPTEHQGTYPLPESQLDRFFLRVRMGYPIVGAEIAMLDWQAAEMHKTRGPLAGRRRRHGPRDGVARQSDPPGIGPQGLSRRPCRSHPRPPGSPFGHVSPLDPRPSDVRRVPSPPRRDASS